jgi:hypothetical protein
MSDPVIFEDSAWPVQLPNLVLVTTHGRAGQCVFIRTGQMRLTVGTWYNVSYGWKPTVMDGE